MFSRTLGKGKTLNKNITARNSQGRGSLTGRCLHKHKKKKNTENNPPPKKIRKQLRAFEKERTKIHEEESRASREKKTTNRGKQRAKSGKKNKGHFAHSETPLEKSAGGGIARPVPVRHKTKANAMKN